MGIKQGFLSLDGGVVVRPFSCPNNRRNTNNSPVVVARDVVEKFLLNTVSTWVRFPALPILKNSLL
jgi:hypothetical protein